MTPRDLAKKLLDVLRKDEARLKRIDNYLHGIHDDPYMPATADAEYKLIAKRAVSNWMPLLVGTPCQAMYVDGFRRGKSRPGEARVAGDAPEWKHWQGSRLDARQAAIYRGAVAYGHSFTVNEITPKGMRVKGLSPMKTAALFEDPANDDTPYVALTVLHYPTDKQRGRAHMWDGTFKYEVSWAKDTDIRVGSPERHGASECPVTRFTAGVDLDGRTVGVIEPMIALQDRINQTVFDLLVAQTFASFKVRYATGMAPPLETDENGDPVLDEQGRPKPLVMDHNARRFLFAEDESVSFGSLDESPLDGFIKSIEMSVRQLAAISQTPPHHLLGEIANLSAEALQAAETALLRKVEEFRKSFGESWERVFRLAAEMSGDAAASEDYQGEVIWRDMESRSLGVTADALGKMAEMLDIPRKGLWPRIPGVTQNELDAWSDLAKDADPAGELVRARRGLASQRPATTEAA